MKKFANWVLDHLKIVATILVFGITLIVIGIVMLASHLSYQKYERDFEVNDLNVRSLSPAQPVNIEFIDDFKSSYGKKMSFDAADLKVETTQTEYLVGDYIDLTTNGGKISVNLQLEEKAFVDVVFTLSSEYKVTEDEKDVYGVKDLLNNTSFVINGETMDDVVDLPNSGPGQEWHRLVMAKFALPAGAVNVTVSSASGKNAMMPQLKNISFFSSQPLAIAEEAAQA